MIKKLSLIAATSLFAVAHSALLVEETFNYSTGSSDGVAATGTGLQDNWGDSTFANNVTTFGTNHGSFIGTSLTAPTGYGFTPTNGSISDNASDFTSRSMVELSTANKSSLSMNSDQTYYMSFLMRTFHGGNRTTRLSLMDGNNATLFAVGEYNTGDFGLDTGSGINTNGTVADGGDNLVVVKITTTSAGTDTISASFWRSGVDTLTSEPVTWAVTDTLNSSVDPIALFFFGEDGFAGDPVGVDEIRIGDSFNAVAIPETSSLILMGVALGACLMIFRLRK